MAIARKANSNPKPAPAAEVDDAAVLRVIGKGLDSSPATADGPKAFNHPLKFPADGVLWRKLEAARTAGMIKIPRNTFILQAILEKLERDGK